MKGGQGRSREASPRDHFTGKQKHKVLEFSLAKKKVDFPGNERGSQMAQNWTHMLPRFAQSRK